MFFRQYIIHENKLSEKLSDDNPYKKKLIKMETPSDKHPIYSTLVFSLLIYGWLFFFTLFYKLFYIAKMSEANFLYIIISSANIIFVTVAIMLTYKKDYLISINPKYNLIAYSIGFISYIFSIIIALTDTGTASWNDIFTSFYFWENINKKSYIALSIVLYMALGISFFYYSSPYLLYRSYYSVHKSCLELSDISEEKSINKGLLVVFLFLLAFFPLIKQSFNPAKDSFSNLLKTFSIAAIGIGIPSFFNTIPAKIYIQTFTNAKKNEKE